MASINALTPGSPGIQIAQLNDAISSSTPSGSGQPDATSWAYDPADLPFQRPTSQTLGLQIPSVDNIAAWLSSVASGLESTLKKAREAALTAKIPGLQQALTGISSDEYSIANLSQRLSAAQQSLQAAQQTLDATNQSDKTYDQKAAAVDSAQAIVNDLSTQYADSVAQYANDIQALGALVGQAQSNALSPVSSGPDANADAASGPVAQSARKSARSTASAAVSSQLYRDDLEKKILAARASMQIVNDLQLALGALSDLKLTRIDPAPMQRLRTHIPA